MEDKEGELQPFNLEDFIKTAIEYHEKVYIPNRQALIERSNHFLLDLLKDSEDLFPFKKPDNG